MIERIAEMLASCSSSKPFFPPTDLYNEGWMLRLILDWSARHGDRMADHPLRVPVGCRWYSEALLESQFKPREKLDKLGEGYTHADGVVGHFDIGGTVCTTKSANDQHPPPAPGVGCWPAAVCQRRDSAQGPTNGCTKADYGRTFLQSDNGFA